MASKANAMTAVQLAAEVKALGEAHAAGKASLINLAKVTYRAVREGAVQTDKLDDVARELYVGFAKASNAAKGSTETLATDTTEGVGKSQVSKLKNFATLGMKPFDLSDFVDHAVKAHKELVKAGHKMMPTYESVVKAARAQKGQDAKLKYADILGALKPKPVTDDAAPHLTSLQAIRKAMMKHRETFIVNGARDTDGMLRELDSILALYQAATIAAAGAPGAENAGAAISPGAASVAAEASAAVHAAA